MFKKGDKVRIKNPKGGMNRYWVIFEMTPEEIAAEKQKLFDFMKGINDPVSMSGIDIPGKRFLGTGYTEEQAIENVRSYAADMISNLALNNVIDVKEAPEMRGDDDA